MCESVSSVCLLIISPHQDISSLGQEICFIYFRCYSSRREPDGVRGSVCPPICLAVGQYHTEHRVQALCGGVSSWIGVGRERRRRVRMDRGCWPAHLGGGVGVGQDGEGEVGLQQAEGRCSGVLSCPFYMWRY